MKPGERIRLIKGAAESLAERPLAEINLTLGEFGLTTMYDPEYHDEPTLAYCMKQLSGAADGTLADISEYVRGDAAAPPTSRPTVGVWGELPLRVFLSHIHAHRHFVGQVRERLRDGFGVDAFVAHDDIDPSKPWREAIKEGLGTCHAFVAFMHDGFHTSAWCDQEAGWALGRSVPIIPVRPAGFNRGATMDGFLEENQDVLLDKAVEDVPRWTASQIVATLLRRTETHQLTVRSLGEAFVSSRSYGQTRTLWGIIAAQPVIEPDTLRRLEYGVQTNSQVYDANVSGTSVAVLVHQLSKKFEPQETTPQDPWGDEPPFLTGRTTLEGRTDRCREGRQVPSTSRTFLNVSARAHDVNTLAKSG